MSVHVYSFDDFTVWKMQFRWQLENSNSRFCLVNKLLPKFDTSLKKNENDNKSKFYDEKHQNMSKKDLEANFMLKNIKKYVKKVYKSI